MHRSTAGRAGSVYACAHVQAKATLNAVNALPQLEQADKLIARMPPAKWATELATAASKCLVICLINRPSVALHVAIIDHASVFQDLRRFVALC